MRVKDYMSRNLVTISNDTTIVKALDLMQVHHIHRLPVLYNGKLVGLITEGEIARSTPSQATSLSIHEMNYLLNKTVVQDVMIKNVITIHSEALLEEAASLMLKENVGCLVVVDNGHLHGIITDKDIFKAFIHISGYNSPGVRMAIEFDHDRIGILEEVSNILKELEMNILQINVYRSGDMQMDGQMVLQIDTREIEKLRAAIEGAGFVVSELDLK